MILFVNHVCLLLLRRNKTRDIFFSFFQLALVSISDDQSRGKRLSLPLSIRICMLKFISHMILFIIIYIWKHSKYVCTFLKQHLHNYFSLFVTNVLEFHNEIASKAGRFQFSYILTTFYLQFTDTSKETLKNEAFLRISDFCV